MFFHAYYESKEMFGHKYIKQNYIQNWFSELTKMALHEGFLSGCGVFIQKQPHEVSYKKAVLKNITIFTGKHLCWSLFLIKLQAPKASSFIKKKLQRS